ncbi:hypothetical protein lerEdw1_003897 [Lerista edwardsae]|nr:hypothetical protein lerEdw1_003897 [Lerista edwardsae]
MKTLMLPLISAVPFLLFFHLLPSGICQKKYLNQIEEWNYREGAEKVNIQGIKSITRMLEKWGNSIFWQMKHSLLSHPNTLLPEVSSLRPISGAIDNLLKQVQSMKKRLAELTERLNIMNRALVSVRYKTLRSPRLNSVPPRRLPLWRQRIFARRPPRRS